MKFSILNLLSSLDEFGHPMSLTYKGEFTYQTLIGGVLSIIMQVLVAIMIINAVIEVYNVDEPTITSFERFIPLEDRNELGTFRFDDYSYVMAFEVEVDIDGEISYELPPKVGHFVSNIEFWDAGVVKRGEDIQVTNCREMIPESAKELSRSNIINQVELGNFYCLEPS